MPSLDAAYELWLAFGQGIMWGLAIAACLTTLENRHRH